MVAILRRRFMVSIAVLVLAGLAVWGFRPSSNWTDLVYATPENAPLTLDLDFPSPRPPSSPVVLFAPYDGDWPRAFKHEPRCRRLYEKLTGHGYAVATLHYRAPGQHRFPCSIEDGKTAVRWLRANAGRYGLDVRRIGIVGVSSGGYGACMLGTTDARDGFEGSGGNTEQSSRVQAVACIGVPAELSVKTWPDGLESLFLWPLLGASYEGAPDLYARASPGSYASPDDPPFLLFHSSEDCMVPVEMARGFADRLRRAGVPVELVEAPGVEHIWGGAKLERALDQTLAFLDRHLRVPARDVTAVNNDGFPKFPPFSVSSNVPAR